MIFASQELVFLVCLSWWTTFYLRYGGRVVGSAMTAPELARIETAIVLSSSLVQAALTGLVILVTDAAAPASFYACACAFTISRSWLNFLGERTRREAHIRAYSALQIGAPLGGLVLTWVLTWALTTHTPATPAAVLGAFALSQAVVGVAVAARLRLLQWPQWPPPALWRAARDFGAPVLMSNLLSWLAGNGIRFVVHHGAGAAALGLLSVGWGLATRLAGVAAMLVTAAAYPLAVKALEGGNRAAALRQLADNSVLLLALLAPVLAVTAVLSEPMTRLLVAPEYQAMTLDVLPWALAGACLRNLRLHGWDPIYLLCEAPRAMMAIDALDAAAMAIAAVLGLWLGGVKGAVVATTVATALVALVDWTTLRWRFCMPTPFWRYARVLLAAALMGAVLQAAAAQGWRTEPRWLDIAATVVVAGALYGAALVLLFPRQSGQALAWLRQRQRRADSA